MKKNILFSIFFLSFGQLWGQFSLGADAFGMTLARAEQKDIGLPLDTAYSDTRFVFAAQSNLSMGYRLKRWEFSLGVGYRQSNWNQRFHASPQEIKDFVGSSSLSDSSDYFGKMRYTGRYYTLPIGAKYLIGAKKESWISAFVAAQLVPSFAYQRLARPKFFDFPFLFPIRSEEDPALVVATEAYFTPKASKFVLDAKLEIGLRVWGRAQRTCGDLSLGYFQGLKPLHEQMGSPRGMFCNFAFHYFFLKKVPTGAPAE